MRLVGLTGGIASGKSSFANALRRLGAPVIDADELARRAVLAGTPALEEVRSAFGDGVLGPSGELDRKRMAALVFADPEARRKLEAIVHPAVRRAVAVETARLAALGHALSFYDVPLLFETGLDRAVDLVVVVYAPRETQKRRLVARDGISDAEAEARLAAQMPIEEKARLADVVVENDGDLASLALKAAPLLAALRSGLSRRLPNAPAARY
ncbi:MAG TPA: dephospho-CoA kinase [Anaeromyxobacteraceae bacterium]|nr:dephospho-CoA kinase [Anaeromyxobacteraceae bacterium]